MSGWNEKRKDAVLAAVAAAGVPEHMRDSFFEDDTATWCCTPCGLGLPKADPSERQWKTFKSAKALAEHLDTEVSETTAAQNTRVRVLARKLSCWCVHIVCVMAT